MTGGLSCPVFLTGSVQDKQSRPITNEAQLAIPETDYALYVLRNGVWTAHPSILKKDRRTLTIEPGTDPHYDGGRLTLGKETDFHSFTWYPVIPKGH